MRIAYLSTFYPYRGGIAQFNASIFRSLEKSHNIQAFTFSRQYPEILFPGKTQMVEDDENADAVPANRVLDSINPFTYLAAASKIRAFDPDVLIMKYWMSFLAPSLGSVAGLMKKKTKVITILDNVIPHEKKFYDNILTKYFLHQNDAFVAMSDAVMKDLHLLKPQAPCVRMDHPLYDHFGNAVSRDLACENLGIDPEKKNILFFGFIRDYKGLDLLIDAFGRLSPEYQLIIAGECYGSFEKYQQQINQSPLKGQIKVFTDYIPDSKVPLFFGAADVCVLPYKSATQSGITSIAYHFEVPMIVTDVGGLKESVHHEFSGLLVQQPKSELITDAVKQYFANPLNIRYKDNIRSLKEKLSWDSFAEGIVNLATSL